MLYIYRTDELAKVYITMIPPEISLVSHEEIVSFSQLHCSIQYLVFQK